MYRYHAVVPIQKRGTYTDVTNKAKKKDSINENERLNGLRMKIMT